MTYQKSFTYFDLDLDVTNVRVDQKRNKVLRSLKERCVVLKLDQVQGIIVADKKYFLWFFRPLIQ